VHGFFETYTTPSTREKKDFLRERGAIGHGESPDLAPLLPSQPKKNITEAMIGAPPRGPGEASADKIQTNTLVILPQLRLFSSFLKILKKSTKNVFQRTHLFCQ